MDFRHDFAEGNVPLAAIHVDSSNQAMRNAGVAFGAGFHAIILASHHQLNTFEFMHICEKVRMEFPKEKILLNFWNRDPDDALGQMRDFDGLCINNVLTSDSTAIAFGVERFLAERLRQLRQVLLFGGVAYKTEKPPPNLGDAVRIAAAYADVIMTSGDEPGEPPTPKKMDTILAAAGTRPMAIAGGLTPKNVSDYRPHAKFLVVSNGICELGKIWHWFDPVKARDFVQAATQ